MQVKSNYNLINNVQLDMTPANAVLLRKRNLLRASARYDNRARAKAEIIKELTRQLNEGYKMMITK